MQRIHWVEKLCEESTHFRNFFFFDTRANALVVDDPQLMFYLRRLSIEQLTRDVGKSPPAPRKSVFVSYAKSDVESLERLQVHLKPLVREGLIDIWDDTRIKPGMRWREEIQAAIDSAAVAIVLVSADLLASSIIQDYELPQFLKKAQDGGTVVIPVVVGHCMFRESSLADFQCANDPDKPISALKVAEREAVLTRVARSIRQLLTGSNAD